MHYRLENISKESAVRLESVDKGFDRYRKIFDSEKAKATHWYPRSSLYFRSGPMHSYQMKKKYHEWTLLTK